MNPPKTSENHEKPTMRTIRLTHISWQIVFLTKQPRQATWQKCCPFCLTFLYVLQTGGQSFFNTDIMQLLTNLFLLAHQLSLACGLRLIGNGLGLPAYGVEENVVDFSLLAADQKAALPSQVQPINHFWHFACFSVHHLLVGNFGCFDHRTSLLSTSSSVWESLDLTAYAPWKRGKRIQINGNVTETWKSNSLKHWNEILGMLQQVLDPNATVLYVLGEGSFQHHTPSQ